MKPSRKKLFFHWHTKSSGDLLQAESTSIKFVVLTSCLFFQYLVYECGMENTIFNSFTLSFQHVNPILLLYSPKMLFFYQFAKMNPHGIFHTESFAKINSRKFYEILQIFWFAKKFSWRKCLPSKYWEPCETSKKEL